MVVLLVSMQGQKAHGFNLCSEDKQRSCGFRRTQGGVINDRFVFILGLNIPSNSSTPKSCNPAFAALSLSPGLSHAGIQLVHTKLNQCIVQNVLLC